MSRAGSGDLKNISLVLPSWWGGRLKALRRIPARDIVGVVVVSLFLLVISTLVVVLVVITV